MTICHRKFGLFIAIADVVVVIVAAIGVFAAVAFVVDPVFTAIIHI